jgi:hypothetical protein
VTDSAGNPLLEISPYPVDGGQRVGCDPRSIKAQEWAEGALMQRLSRAEPYGSSALTGGLPPFRPLAPSRRAVVGEEPERGGGLFSFIPPRLRGFGRR